MLLKALRFSATPDEWLSTNTIHEAININQTIPQAMYSHSIRNSLFGSWHNIKTWIETILVYITEIVSKVWVYRTRSTKFWSCSLSATRSTYTADRKPMKCKRLGTTKTNIVSPNADAVRFWFELLVSNVTITFWDVTPRSRLQGKEI